MMYNFHELQTQNIHYGYLNSLCTLVLPYYANHFRYWSRDINKGFLRPYGCILLTNPAPKRPNVHFE